MISPPFQVRDLNGQPAGISVDLVNQAARRRGIRLQWIYWNNSSQSALVQKKVDLWPLITITPERLKLFHISEPYLQHDYCLLVRDDTPGRRPTDFSTAKIGMANAAIDTMSLRKVLPNAQPAPRSTISAVIDDVCRGDSGAAFMDRYTAVSALLQQPGCGSHSLRWIPIPQLRLQLGVGSTFEATAAADAIRGEIGSLAREGKLAEVFGQWGFMSSQDVGSVESLVNARRREARLIAVTVIFALMLLVACGQSFRLVRERSRTRRTEEALRESQARYMQAQKMESIGRLAGGVAHDFNNLLTVINGYSDLLYQQLPEDDVHRGHADEIRKAGARAAELTHQLLAFGRKQVGRPRPVNLTSLVTESEKMLRLLVGTDVNLITRLDPSLGMVMADPGHLHQVLMNLAANARDAMPHGGSLTIETSNALFDSKDVAAVPESKPGPAVRLCVRDTGVGMDEKTRKNIFEPFFTTKGNKGTGLGLATVYGIVQQNRGWIDVSSEPGKGSTFQVFLPRVNGVEEAAATVPANKPAKRAPSTILVVEDQDDVRAFVSGTLSARGYRILQAADGPQALMIAKQHAGTIDLVLTDVVLPGMNGREVAESLRDVRPGIKLIYTSGYTQDIIASHGVLNPGVTYVPKPYTSEAIVAHVEAALDVGQASA
jgi:signal transduction histidine kinase/CheY-like chemotaxis protein